MVFKHLGYDGASSLHISGPLSHSSKRSSAAFKSIELNDL